jgi:hypothetical protein
MGCHDALRHVKKTFQGAHWFIEGDISKCFDEIDHDLLIGTLRERIKDERFIRLIWKALRAGYLDTWKVPMNCLVGTPQGSIVSPILTNIFLHNFDKFVMNELAPEFNLGLKRKQPVEYTRAVASCQYFYNKYKRTGDPNDLAKAKASRKIMQSQPSVDPHDPDFRRLYFVRYADDWLIGFAGPRKEAEEIKQRCAAKFTQLKLRLNQDKTTITPASEGCTFLGTRIHIPRNAERFKKGVKVKARANLGPRLNAPLERVIKKLSQGGYCDSLGKPLPRFAWYAADKDEIVGNYTSVLRGLLNYYSFADNYLRLACSVYYILRGSMAKLLAAKFKTRTARQALIRFGKSLEREGERAFPHYRDPALRGGSPRTDYFQLGDRTKPTLDALFVKARLTIRVANLECCACGSTRSVEMHHIRHLKDLNKRLDPISRAMAARRRKQIPLCRVCHMHKHVSINRIGVDNSIDS